MTTGHIFIATSLDGYIARKDHSVDWLNVFNSGEEDTGFEAFMSQMDGLVMGSGTFKSVLSFDAWPYTIPVIVMSRHISQKDVPDHLREKVTISTQSPQDLMETLYKKGWKKAYIDGGKLIQSFIKAGLIHDMTITQVPLLLGQGLPLFGPLDADQKLILKHIKNFPSGLVQSIYEFEKRKA